MTLATGTSRTSQHVGVLAGAFLSGAMMSLCFTSVPVILDTAADAKHLGRQWEQLFHYGHRIFPAMAVGIGLIHGYTAIVKRRCADRSCWAFALAGVATVSIAPFTWAFMAATNRQLFELAPNLSQLSAAEMLSATKDLVVKWARLHLVRSLLPLAGTLLAASAAFA
ncbi:hypothetical protein IF1G_09601 [Cordyceps javanica]|uniref:DUF1772-domain-containing protein n=1 Tax=Cordyceps javanica TaxID=43265 RepID=A0A545VPP1_9HYPO|nr:hypothetical protein IF1G_09601 [Cordyceps javanica]TQW03682.1 hypothetical protein IF2G_08980 [Cordyceps javanica]